MRFKNIKDKEPNIGDIVLVYGDWEGELSSQSEGDLGYHVVEYLGNRYGNITGCCGYGAWVYDITKWAKLPKDENK